MTDPTPHNADMLPLPPLALPEVVNYVAVFLSFDCNLDCSYCINDPEQRGERRAMIRGSQGNLAAEDWVRGLSRLRLPADLPLTLQGGEPLLYGGGFGLRHILAGVDHSFDLLTNFALPPARFGAIVAGLQHRLRREAPYPAIRVSYHPAEMERTWQGRGIEELVARCEALAEYGFDVSPTKADSDVGIYMVAHPENTLLPRILAATEGRVPFETKEFLGLHQGQLYGTYRYPYSTDLVASGVHPTPLTCTCRTSELLLDPAGFAWGCHFHLYEAWKRQDMPAALAALAAAGYRFGDTDKVFAGMAHRPLGHLLDPDFDPAVIRLFRPCHHYGLCIGCDTKVKNNRFQSLDDAHVPHTSVEIRNIDFPASVLARMEAEQRRKAEGFLPA